MTPLEGGKTRANNADGLSWTLVIAFTSLDATNHPSGMQVLSEDNATAL